MNNILVHIPHSSLELPSVFWENVILDREKVLYENKFLCDERIDGFVPVGFNTLKFPYSRMFCDVERFRNDCDEVMASIGMGVVYSKTSDGENFITYDLNYKEKVLRDFYDRHHLEFYNRVQEIIEKFGKCYIIDLHSFSDLLVYKLLGKEDLPDICIGVDYDFYDESLVKEIINHFESYQYNVMINYPYSGTVVPMPYYLSKDVRVKSLMIEVNKRIYLYDKENFMKFSSCMDQCFSKILSLKMD